MLATAAILDAQVTRYSDLPKSVDGIHGHCNDPCAHGYGGMFGKDEDGDIILIRGKYKGRSLNEIARAKPDYLEWMQREDFFDDTKRIAMEAAQAGVLTLARGFPRRNDPIMDDQASPTNRPGRCRLRLTINGLHYGVRPINSQDDAISRAFRLSRKESIFDVALTRYGAVW